VKDLFVKEMSRLNLKQQKIISAANRALPIVEEVTEELEQFSIIFSTQAMQQAAAIAQSGVTVEHIEKIAEKTARDAKLTRNIAQKTVEYAEKTLFQLQMVRSGFNKVIGTNEDARRNFAELAAQAENIDEVIRLNRDMAGQIKILAINASIQAAKAGDYGTGFSVVAKELKSMILQTDKSLKESQLLLESIQEKARQSAMSIISSSDLLLEHYEALESTGDLIDKISAAINQNRSEFDIIANSAKEQKIGIAEMNTGIHQIEDAANSLSRQAENILNSVKKLLDSQQHIGQILGEEIKEKS
jgi:methyl-accepting chemotaxis protein